LAPELFAEDGQGRVALRGGRRVSDGRIVFPMPEGAAAEGYEPCALPQVGELWSYTLQSYPPNAPPYAVEEAGGFEPFAVGYVSLPGAVIVASRLLVDSPADLRVGAPMELRLAPVSVHGRGRVSAFAFASVRSQEAQA
jgi:uncharacterized OB-fold protein